jgi:hypothetical protein
MELECGLDESGLVEGRMTGCCEHGNEPSCSMRGGEFLDLLSNYQLLKTDSVPWS